MIQGDKDWKSKLTDEQYRILRNKDTESPFTGSLLHNDKSGVYFCAGCGNKLFGSVNKFDSGSGWPSFDDIISDTSVVLLPDESLGISRVEVECAKCQGHLGHVFDDGPAKTTGKRYCINSGALDFKETNE